MHFCAFRRVMAQRAVLLLCRRPVLKLELKIWFVSSKNINPKIWMKWFRSVPWQQNGVVTDFVSMWLHQDQSSLKERSVVLILLVWEWKALMKREFVELSTELWFYQFFELLFRLHFCWFNQRISDFPLDDSANRRNWLTWRLSCVVIIVVGWTDRWVY